MTRRAGRSARRGTSLLYVTGFSAVLFLLLFGLSESSLRGAQQVRRANMRVEAEWIAEAGAVWGRLHLEELRRTGQPSQPVRCGQGSFVCLVEKDAGADAGPGERLVVRASTPFDKPRVHVRQTLKLDR